MDTTQPEQNTTQPEQNTTQPGNEPSSVKSEPTSVKKEPSPSQAPKTHTLDEVERLVQFARRDRGKEMKDIQTERDSFKAQSEKLTSQIEDANESIKTLDARIDDLSSDDPRRFDAIKELREARAERLTLKTDRQVLDADKVKWGDRVKLSEDTLREISINEIAAKHEGGEPQKLKDICDLTGAVTDEEIDKAADILWPRKTVEHQLTPLVPFSGRTSGGSTDWRKLSPQERIQYGLDHKM